MYTGLKNAGIKVRHEKQEIYITVNYIKQHIDTLYQNRTYTSLAERTQQIWKDKTDKANERGNKIHNYLEDSINISLGDVKGRHNKLINPLSDVKANELSTELLIIRTKNDLDATDLKETYPQIYNRLLEFVNMGCTIFAEKRIYSTIYGIAGTIDVLVIKGKKFWIVDWKTNKDEMKFIAGYYKKVQIDGEWVKSDNFIETNDKLAFPLNNLANCKGMIYSMQLSVYSYMMELWGYEPAENHLEIYHMRPHRKPRRLKIKYYRQEAKKLFEHHLAKGLKTADEVKDSINKFGFGIT